MYIKGDIYKNPSFEEIEQHNTSTDYKLYSSSKGSNSAVVVGLFLEVDASGCPRFMFDTKSRKATPLARLEGSGRLFIEELLDTLAWSDPKNPEIGPFLDQKTIYFTEAFYHMEALLRDLPIESAIELKSTLKTRVKDLRIWYTPRKRLTIRRDSTKQQIRLVSLEAWPHRDTLKESLKLYNIQHKLSDFYDPENTAVALKNIGLEIKKYLLEILHVSKDALDLSSSSTVTDGLLARSFLNTKFNKVPNFLQEKYFNHIHTPWIQTSIIGTQYDFLDADINKAYAWSAINTPYLGPEINEYVRDSKFHPEAIAGMVKIRATVNNTPINPATLRMGRTPVAVQGNIVDWYTKQEVEEFIEGNWISNVKILDGVWVVPTDETFFPFKNMENILRLQENALSKYTSEALKSICREIYIRFVGKTRTVLEYESLRDDDLEKSEKKYVAGPFFSPLFCSEIQARTKVRVAKEIRLNKLIESTSFVHTDGFGGTNPGLKVPRSSKTPGEMKWTTYPEATIVSAVIKDIEGLKSEYSGLRSLMEESPLSTRIELPKERRMTFFEAIELNRLTDTSKLYLYYQQIRVRNTHKRYFPVMPLVNEDMLHNSYKSLPIHAEELRRIKKRVIVEKE